MTDVHRHIAVEVTQGVLVLTIIEKRIDNWDLAESHMSKARDEDRRGDRDAIETYRDAISAFGDYRKQHPKSGHLKPRTFNGRKLPPMITDRIQAANNAINQIRSRRR